MINSCLKSISFYGNAHISPILNSAYNPNKIAIAVESKCEKQ